MKKPIELLENFLNLDRYGEDLKYNQNLYAVTLFPNTTLHAQGRIYQAVLNFGFRNIDFNKKRALPFFFAMELLTKQKCIATLSSKNILA